MSGFERKGKPNVLMSETRSTSTTDPKIAETFTQAEAKVAGYTGSICEICGSTRMRVAGHCMVCDDCGTTTGCS